MGAAVRHRIDARPAPADWADDDLMSLVEFALVFGADSARPVYPITVSAMRTEIHRGRLTASYVGGSYWVTPASVKALFQCPVSPKVRVSTSEKGGSTPRPARAFQIDGSSETARLRSAQAAALSAWETPNDNSQDTSPKSGKGRKGTVIRLAS